LGGRPRSINVVDRLGHSFGGLVALEIARLLSEAGQTVELVGLLDTHLPRTATAQAQFTFEPMIERPSGSAVIRRAREALQAQGRRILPGRLPAVQVWSRQARAHLAGVIPHVGQRQFDAFFDHGQITSRRYRVQPSGGRVLLELGPARGTSGAPAAVPARAVPSRRPADLSSLDA
jgi:pimeloyl-ACP methyl ester carboxylesterase